MPKNLLSRKEVYSQLGISESTLRRKLQEFNIQCVNEMLPNGVISSKIKYEDFLRIAHNYKKANNINAETSTQINISTKDLPIIYNLKAELVKAQVNLIQAENTLNEKENLIQNLQYEKVELEEKNIILFDQFMQTNDRYVDALKQIEKLQAKLFDIENSKNIGFFQRILGRYDQDLMQS